MHSPGEILLVPIPFTDLSSHKRRPVLVLSKQEYNKQAQDLIVAAITSLIDTKPYAVMFSNDDMVDGNLKVDSCIRADKIYTLSQTLVVKRFGRVKSEIVDMVKTMVMDVIG
ncbi:MAG: type II toxin-antitoxin system PemK/MazF family toxin [Defluviitaleaceae bacterium]|nr:type II toxin-antitoxin system PemK/MazF family toxin [Defluviitaleaceae bacterium]